MSHVENPNARARKERKRTREQRWLLAWQKQRQQSTLYTTKPEKKAVHKTNFNQVVQSKWFWISVIYILIWAWWSQSNMPDESWMWIVVGQLLVAGLVAISKPKQDMVHTNDQRSDKPQNHHRAFGDMEPVVVDQKSLWDFLKWPLEKQIPLIGVAIVAIALATFVYTIWRDNGLLGFVCAGVIVFVGAVIVGFILLNRKIRIKTGMSIVGWVVAIVAIALGVIILTDGKVLDAGAIFNKPKPTVTLIPTPTLTTIPTLDLKAIKEENLSKARPAALYSAATSLYGRFRVVQQNYEFLIGLMEKAKSEKKNRIDFTQAVYGTGDEKNGLDSSLRDTERWKEKFLVSVQEALDKQFISTSDSTRLTMLSDYLHRGQQALANMALGLADAGGDTKLESTTRMEEEFNRIIPNLNDSWVELVEILKGLDKPLDEEKASIRLARLNGYVKAVRDLSKVEVIVQTPTPMPQPTVRYIPPTSQPAPTYTPYPTYTPLPTPTKAVPTAVFFPTVILRTPTPTKDLGICTVAAPTTWPTDWRLTPIPTLPIGTITIWRPQ